MSETACKHCWHAMNGSTSEMHAYACCWGDCNDVLLAGPREVEEKTHGVRKMWSEPGWPGTVRFLPPRTET